MESTPCYWKIVNLRFHLIVGSVIKIFKTMGDLERYCVEHNLQPVKAH